MPAQVLRLPVVPFSTAPPDTAPPDGTPPGEAPPDGRPPGEASSCWSTEVERGLRDSAGGLRRCSRRELRASAHDAGIDGRRAYSDGVRAGFVLAHDRARMRVWELGYAAGEEDAVEVRRSAGRRGAPSLGMIALG